MFSISLSKNHWISVVADCTK